MIYRDHQEVVQQYVNWQDLIQYIDDLKSRIYKAFFGKLHLKACRLQSLCIKSLIVLAAATKSSIKNMDFHFSFFELGYLIFCLSNNLYLDASFYFYYRETPIADILRSLPCLIERIKLLMLTWSIQPYQDYLISRKKFLYYTVNNIDGLDSFMKNRTSGYNHVLCLNLKPCFHYLYLFTLISRLSMSKDIKRYLLLYLNHGIFSYFISCLDLSFNYAIFEKSNNGFFYKLLNIFTSCVCYEIYAILYASGISSDSMITISLANYGSAILILFQNFSQLQFSLKEIKNFLLFNGAKLTNALPMHSSGLFNGISINSVFVSLSNKVYPFCFVIRPSLLNQFSLMKQISLILFNSVSQPLFALVIRLNRLLLLWSNIYIGCQADKIFYLVDYLVYLKLRLFVKKQALILHDVKVDLYVKSRCFTSSIYLSGKVGNLMLVNISNYIHYRLYLSIRVFWMYKIKCLSN